MLFPDGDGLGVVSAVVISALPALSLREDFFNLRNFDHCCQRFSAMRLPGSPRLGAWKPMGLSSALNFFDHGWITAEKDAGSGTIKLNADRLSQISGADQIRNSSR